MPDENVDRWKQQGRLYLWRYTRNTRNYPGWHLTAGRDFIESFAVLIELMQAAPYSSQKSIELTAPTRKILSVPNNQSGRAAWQSAQTLILQHRPEHPVDYSDLEENAGKVTICAGRQTLESIKECLLRLPKEIDYSFVIGNTRLRFW